MRRLFQRGDLQLSKLYGPTAGGVAVVVGQPSGRVILSPEDLRWLCLVAGPALLNELAKGEGDGDR